MIKSIRKELYEIEKGLESENENEKKQYAKKLEELWERIKKNYYNPRKTKSAFDDNYVEYESRGDKDKNVLFENYLAIIKPFLRDMIDNYKTHDKWEIQLTTKIIFISSLSTGEFRIMHLKSDNAKIMTGFKADDIINELFQSSLKSY